MPNLTVTAPPALVQSERPVHLRVQSEVLGSNTFPEVVFIFADTNLNPNQSITFLNYTFIGTGVDPETSPFEFESNLNGRKAFVRAFQRIPQLARDWQIWESISGKIHIRRNFPGVVSGLTVTEQNMTGFVLYPAESSDGSAATFGDQSEEYRLCVRIYEDLLNSADFPYADYQREFRGELVLGYQPNNIYDFDLSPFLGEDFEDYLPDLVGGFQAVPGSVRYFNYQVYEGYLNSADYPVEIIEHTSSADRIVIFGKKGFIDIADYWQSDPHLPLMSTITSRILRRDEHQFLIFYYDATAGTLRLSIDLMFRNGTTSTVELEALVIAGRSVYYVNVGFDQLGLSTYESEFVKVQSYQVKVIDTIAVQDVTLPVEYIPREECEDLYTVAFQNDFGMYELFTFSGNMERGATYQVETIKRPVPVTEDLQAVETAIISNDSVFERTLYSHGLKPANFDALEELVKSDQVYYIEDGAYIPVIISNFQYGPRDDKESLYFVSITIQPSQSGVVI